MILQPSFIDDDEVEKARKAATKKKENQNLVNVILEPLEEGKSAQITHVGPWSAEAENIEKVKEFILKKSGKPKGKHHEIYMSDPRRVPPEKLKTVIRQPFTIE
jgi:hypothetical protein